MVRLPPESTVIFAPAPPENVVAVAVNAPPTLICPAFTNDSLSPRAKLSVPLSVIVCWFPI